MQLFDVTKNIITYPVRGVQILGISEGDITGEGMGLIKSKGFITGDKNITSSLHCVSGVDNSANRQNWIV